MPLFDIRNEFLKATGRDDLGTQGTIDSAEDSGADYFINAGQKILDRKISYDRANARYMKNKSAGQWYQHLMYCRAITSVLMLKDDEYTPLEKIDNPIDLLRYYGKPPEQLTIGTPVHYAIWINQLSPEQDEITSNDISTEASRHTDDLLFYEDEDNNPECKRTIIFLPPTDEEFTLVVVGLFESRELVENGDRSYWTEQHPFLLVAAAQFCLEQHYRNTEGMRDHKNFIDEYILGLSKDKVLEEIAENDFMRG